MEILITFWKKMSILEPHRIASFVLKIYKVLNCIYHTLKIYQLTELKIFFSLPLSRQHQKMRHLGSQSTIRLWPKLTVGNIKSQISILINSTLVNL